MSMENGADVAKGALLNLTLWVCILGYFVDIYDLVAFGIVRIESLGAIGVPKSEVLDRGILLLNLQMAGMVLGGFLWGALGDRIGRRRALLTSIFLYSVGTLLNASVTSLGAYAVLRVVSGFGLAGEVGLAVTLISEHLPPLLRGHGTALYGGVGFLGTFAAAATSHWLGWRGCFAFGGALGFVLLQLRMRLVEPAIFERARLAGGLERGKLARLVRPPARLRKYLACILAGIPIYLAVGIFVNLSPELSQALGLRTPVSLAVVSALFSVGGAAGAGLSGLASARLGSRKRVLHGGTAGVFTVCAALVLFGAASLPIFYTGILLLGFATSYWVVLATTIAEQWGTELRATAATSALCLIRGTAIPITLLFQALKGPWVFWRQSVCLAPYASR